jgi:Protein of unknown function (DUF1572)
MARDPCLDDVDLQMRTCKRLAEAALAQIDETDRFRTLGPDENGVAVVVKHVAGNHPPEGA